MTAPQGVDPSIIAAVLSLVAVVVSAWIAARASIRVKAIEGRETPYDKLADRVVHLEDADRKKSSQLAELRDEVDRLKKESREDRDYIVLAARWIDDHAPGKYTPPRLPAWLRRATTTPEGHA